MKKLTNFNFITCLFLKKIFSILLFLSFSISSVFAQKSKFTEEKDIIKSVSYDPLRPAKASFYSAIVPGLGQVYNKQYWKVPLVYGAIGTSLYFYIDSKKNYNIYRDEYKNRLKGEKSESLYLYKLSDEQLIEAQKGYKRNADFSALFVIGFYVLNIIDANVAAALSQFNVNDQLALNPKLGSGNNSFKSTLGFQALYSF